MKSFPAAFTTELNKKTGITPVWILRLTVNGVVYDLSDTMVTFPSGMLNPFPNGFTVTLPWIGSWGEMRESISGTLGEMQISDFSCTVLVDQNVTDNIRHLALQHPLEQSAAEIYLWFDGLTTATPPQKLFVGYVKDIDIPDETQVHLTIEDESTRFQKYLGTRITSEEYPLCDPDVVGKMIPIVYGTASKLPGLCVDSGWVSTIPSGLSISATEMVVSEIPSYSLVNAYLWVEEEIVRVSAQNGKTLTITRAQSSTTAVEHTNATVVIEKKTTPLVYLLADHSVNVIGTVMARVRGVNVDISDDVVKYLGTTENQLAAYPGKAAVTISDIVRVSQKISLALQNSLSVNQGNHTHPTSTSNTVLPMTNYSSVSGYWVDGNNIINNTNCAYLFDGNYATFARPANTYGNRVTLSKTTAYSTGNPLYIRFGINYGGNVSDYQLGTANIYVNGVLVESMSLPDDNLNNTTRYSGWHVLASWAILYSTGNTYVVLDCRADTAKIYETFWEVMTGTPNTYSSATGVALAGSLSMSGNSVADVAIGDQLVADVTRNITTPSMVVYDLLATYCNDTTLTLVGSMPSNYTFNGAITEYKRIIEWLDYFAFQCQSYFRKSAGVSRLLVRTLNPIPLDVISTCCLTAEGIRDLSYKKAPISDVINKITVLYDRDWSVDNKQAESYSSSMTDSNASSVSLFGEQEQPSLFMFDFVTDATMASDLSAFYMGFYSSRKWRISFSTFLDCAQYEFGDLVTLMFTDNTTSGMLVEAGFSPGSVSNMDKMNFVLLSN